MNQVCAVSVTAELRPLGFQAPSLEGWYSLRWEGYRWGRLGIQAEEVGLTGGL